MDAFAFVYASLIAAFSKCFHQLTQKSIAGFSTTSLLLPLADGDEW